MVFTGMELAWYQHFVRRPWKCPRQTCHLQQQLGVTTCKCGMNHPDVSKAILHNPYTGPRATVGPCAGNGADGSGKRPGNPSLQQQPASRQRAPQRARDADRLEQQQPLPAAEVRQRQQHAVYSSRPALGVNSRSTQGISLCKQHRRS